MYVDRKQDDQERNRLAQIDVAFLLIEIRYKRIIGV